MVTTTKSKSAEYYLEMCRRHLPGGRRKTAELGGSGDDVPFEQAFSSLAHALIKDKAPTLLDHELGFQLLDRNEDNTKAVAVMAFKLGSQYLFAPVFFLKGKLKGHELLWLKNQDVFVPLKENYLNMLKNRKPQMIGTGVTRQTSQLGVLQPNYNRLAHPPHNKFSSWVIPAVQEFLPKFGSLTSPEAFTKEAKDLTTRLRTTLSLPGFLKQASPAVLGCFIRTMQNYPWFAATFDKFHGIDTLQSIVKEASLASSASVMDEPKSVTNNRIRRQDGGSVLAKEGAEAVNKVKILTPNAAVVEGNPPDISEEEREKFLRDAVLIKDDRDEPEVSKVYNVSVTQKLFNPNESGLYMVLVKPGGFEKCFIAVSPHGPNGRKGFVTVARVGDQANWSNMQARDVWCAAKIEGDEFKEWYDGLPAPTSLKARSRAVHILIGANGNSTCPFQVEKSLGDGRDGQTYEVDFEDYGPSSAWGQPERYSRYETTSSHDDYSKWDDGQRIHLDGKDGTGLRSNRGDLWVPKGFKLLTVKAAPADDDDRIARLEKEDKEEGGSPTPPIRPGNIIDAEIALLQKTAALRLSVDGNHVTVNGQPPLQKIAALIHLVRDHGLREEAARHLIKQAALGKRLNLRIKYAMGYSGSPYLRDSGPSAPSMQEQPPQDSSYMGVRVPEQPSYEYSAPVDDMSAAHTDRNIYDIRPDATPSPYDLQAVQQAAGSGQKEVFDTSAISAMLKTVRDDTMVDRYLPELVKGMDSIGRILFMFYWHGDKFAERYGKQDMPELEDTLRNAFEMVGDLLLFLEQKMVTPYSEEGAGDLLASPSSSQSAA